MSAPGRGLAIAGIALLTLLLLPEIAAACAVCTGGEEEESRFAFIGMTVFLSVLPLAMIGGLAWFIRRAYRIRDTRLASRPTP